MSCSRRGGTSSSGDVKLAVVLPGGVTISNVTYTVLSSSNATIAGPGTFRVTNPNASISLDIVVPVTPAGDAGDEVQLSATDSLGNSCTGTSPRFPVAAGTNPAVTMTLACGSATAPNATGNIGVTATVVEGDHCPNITSGVVAPDTISVGSTANVAATASDADVTETLTYAWAPAANFAAPTSATTTYKCLTAGPQTFTLVVTDSHTPTTCSTTATFTITCVAVTGGGGAAGAGGTGTGGTGTGGSIDNGGSLACRTCELQGTQAGDCFNTSPAGQGTSVANYGCEGLPAAQLASCQTLLFCLQGQACQAAIAAADVSFSEAALGNDSPLPCLCGTAFVTDASSSAHDKCATATSGFNGPCASLFAAAANGGSVTGNFTNNQIAEGVAVNLMSCDIDHPCITQCGVGLPFSSGSGGGGVGTGGSGGLGGSLTGAGGSGGIGGRGGSGGSVTGSGGNSAGGATGTGGMPVDAGPPSCVDCELSGTIASNCFNTSATGHGATTSDFGCESLTGTNQTNCLSLLQCLRSQACQSAIAAADPSFSETALGNDNPLPCLCGTAFAHDACVISVAGFNGVCAAQFAAAANGGTVTGNFTNNNIAEGVAVNLMSCDIDNSCQGLCGVSAGSGGSGGSSGSGGATGGAGGGAVGTGGVGGSLTGSGGTGGTTDPCVSCEFAGVIAANCFNTSAPGHGATTSDFGCTSLTGTAQTSCLSLLQCLQSRACQAAIAAADPSYSEALLGDDSALPCLCGTAFVTTSSSTAHDACVTATAGFNGVCAAQFAAAANGGGVTNNFTNNASAEGVATNLFSCDIDNSCQAACGISGP